MVAKCLNRSVLSWSTLCLVIKRTHIYNTYIYIYTCVCPMSIYIYIYVCICLFIYLSIYTISISTSLCLYVCMFTPFSKELPFSVPDGRSGAWTRRGGGTGSRWKIISNQGGPKPVRHGKSCELYPVSRQYIAKANPTPASKLAFVTWENSMRMTN